VDVDYDEDEADIYPLDDDWDDYDPSDRQWDDDLEPPNCTDCGDTGAVRAGRLYVLLRREEYRRCRSCTAGWLWYLRWRLTGRLVERWRYSRLAAWWRRVDARLRGIDLSDEPPF
jgi:hypothetical protein